MNKTAWGLDIAGFSTNKSILALAEINTDNKIGIKLYHNNPFNIIRNSNMILSSAIENEVRFISNYITSNNCKIFIDTPLDIQVLLDSSSHRYIWQLTKRPVDKSFGALSPLADRIGSSVARTKYLISKSTTDKLLGYNIFETYPAGSLQCLGLPHTGYKKKPALWSRGKWDDGLNNLPSKLNIKSKYNKLTITDDDLDATLCALCGVVDDDYTLKGSQLDEHITTRINNGITYKAPTGYVLLQLPKRNPNKQKWPYTIEIEKVDHSPLDESNTT